MYVSVWFEKCGGFVLVWVDEMLVCVGVMYVELFCVVV